MTEENQILYARPGDEFVVFRVIGRGTFQNSMPLRKTALDMREEHPDLRFIIDLEECDGMDSTFMGVLASLGLKGRSGATAGLVLVNVNEHAKRLLDTLGLSHFLDVRARQDDNAAGADLEFEPTDDSGISKREQIVHMIEAHKELVNVDDSNQARFQNVLRYLSESLERVDRGEEA